MTDLLSLPKDNQETPAKDNIKQPVVMPAEE